MWRQKKDTMFWAEEGIFKRFRILSERMPAMGKNNFVHLNGNGTG